MAVDIFLKLTDIDGESRDDAHKNEIEVLAWSWDLSQAGTFIQVAVVGLVKLTLATSI